MPPPDVGQLMPNGFQVSSPTMRITAATTDTANKIRLPAAGSVFILNPTHTHTPMPTGNTNTNAFKSDAPTPSHFQLAALVLVRAESSKEKRARYQSKFVSAFVLVQLICGAIYTSMSAIYRVTDNT
ncbi:hypothetical protein ACLKA6_001721 [Drosophila palustris]